MAASGQAERRRQGRQASADPKGETEMTAMTKYEQALARERKRDQDPVVIRIRTHLVFLARNVLRVEYQSSGGLTRKKTGKAKAIELAVFKEACAIAAMVTGAPTPFAECERAMAAAKEAPQ
jgi:hypothetical protein